MSRYPTVPLGEVLELSLDEVAVQPDEDFAFAGVYSFGRGLFKRSSITGSQTKYKKLLRLDPDRFVLSRLKAWEGAVAVVTDEFEGCVVSAEFPTFRINRGRLDPQFLGWICRWEAFWSELSGRARGIGARRDRVHPDRLVKASIPLPDLPEQARIVALLDRLDDQMVKAMGLAEESKLLSDYVIDSTLRHLVEQSGWPTKPLSGDCAINPSPKPKTELGQELMITFVPMSAVDDRTGTIAAPEVRVLSDVGGGYRQFLEGDVIFARITPSMQNGKSAVATSLENGIGYGSTEFHVLRPGPELNAKWLHFLLRSNEIRDAAQASFKGTAGQQRVPASFLENLSIPVPSPEEQRDAVSLLERVRARMHEIHARRARSKIEMKAFIPATLNSLLGSN
jgi:type I restriction enzyme S subunit